MILKPVVVLFTPLFLLTFFISGLESISLNKRLKNIPKCCPIGLAYRRHPETGKWYCGSDEYKDDDEYFRKSIKIQYQILQRRTRCEVNLIKPINMNSKLQVTVDGKLRINYNYLVDENFCIEKDGEQNILSVFTCDEPEKKISNEIDSHEVQQVMETKNRMSFEENSKVIPKCCHYGEGLARNTGGVWICQPLSRSINPRDFLAAKNLQYHTHPTCMRTSKYYDSNIGNIRDPLQFVRNNFYIQLYSEYCVDRENRSDRVMIFYC